MMRFVALSLAILAAVLLLGAPAVAPASASAGDLGPSTVSLSASTSSSTIATTSALSDSTVDSLASESPPNPETTFEINLQSDRSADWVVTAEYTLATPEEQAAFDDLAAEFEAGDSDHGPDISLYENMAALAADQTNREMEVESIQRTSSRTGDTGTLRLSFTWTEFLEETDDRLVFNDALATPEGDTWLTSLDEDQTLRITTPRGYSITSANVAFTDQTVEIEGPHTFDPDDHVRITLESTVFASTWQLIVGALVIAFIVGGALYIRRQGDSSSDVDGTVDDADRAVGTDSAAADSSVDATADAPATEPEPPEDLSLLADDERVIRLLERNGGRMRQANIVRETEWSDAKVSQLLSSMADDDRIKKLRIGRENLISLPDVDAFGPKPGEETEEDGGDTADGLSD